MHVVLLHKPMKQACCGNFDESQSTTLMHFTANVNADLWDVSIIFLLHSRIHPIELKVTNQYIVIKTRSVEMNLYFKIKLKRKFVVFLFTVIFAPA
jgi:hypothetical protein